MKKQNNIGWKVALALECVCALCFAIRIIQGFTG
jgi:hypothetical protein